jgi:hypothetical protein
MTADLGSCTLTSPKPPPDVPASLCYLCSLIPRRLPRLLSLTSKPAFIRIILNSGSCLLFGSLVRASGCWRFHSVLPTNQPELSSTVPLPFCFLYNPKFRLADCSAYHLPSCWFLIRLNFRSWRWWRYVPPKRLFLLYVALCINVLRL